MALSRRALALVMILFASGCTLGPSERGATRADARDPSSASASSAADTSTPGRGEASARTPEERPTEPTRAPGPLTATAATTPPSQPQGDSATRSTPSAEIRKVVVQPKQLVPGQEDPVTFDFVLPSPGRVSIEILDESGAPIRVLDGGPRDPGEVRMIWNGRLPNGAPVPPGVYLVRIRAQLADGGEAVYGASPLGGGDEVLARRFTYDREARRFSFLLPQPSRVRVRMGIQRFPHLRTLFDWVPMGAGSHELSWDGLDASGLIQMGPHPELTVHLEAFALPANALIAQPAQGPMPARTAGRPVYAGPYLHSAHPGADCHEPSFAVELEGAKPGPDGVPVVEGVVPVRVTLDPSDRAHLINHRFEVMLFVDTVFLFEEEDGSAPFTYQLDTRALAPGPHILTVNVIAYDDHVGVQTLRFVKGGS